MPREPGTRLSVIVVTYNSRAVLPATLPALRNQLAAEDELVIVDNASSDDTVDVVREVTPRARLIRNDRNLGFAAGANMGARAATGDLLVFLNPDAAPEPGFAEAIRGPLNGAWSAWMGLVTHSGGRFVNTNGGVIHFTGIAWAGEVGAPAPGSLREPRDVAFASGACLAVPRAEWSRVGGFAEDYFMYQEDVDLSLRVRLAGGRLGVEPAAVVDHDYEFAKGPTKWRRLERNRWATIVRCYPGALLVVVAPALLITELALVGVAAANGWLPQKLAATFDTTRALPRLLRERREVQLTRTISAAEFAAWLTPELNSVFLGRLADVRPLGWALGAYWRLAVAALAIGNEVRPLTTRRSQ